MRDPGLVTTRSGRTSRRSATGSTIDERTWRAQIAAAFTPYDGHHDDNGYVGYREAAGCAAGVLEVIAALDELIESDLESAWQTAHEYGCPDQLRLTIAIAREADHPGDSIAVYRLEIERRIAVKNNDSYAAAVDLLDRIRKLGVASGDDRDFRELIVEIRRAHKPKRNLMALLTQRRW